MFPLLRDDRDLTSTTFGFDSMIQRILDKGLKQELHHHVIRDLFIYLEFIIQDITVTSTLNIQISGNVLQFLGYSDPVGTGRQ